MKSNDSEIQIKVENPPTPAQIWNAFKLIIGEKEISDMWRKAFEAYKKKLNKKHAKRICETSQEDIKK